MGMGRNPWVSAPVEFEWRVPLFLYVWRVDGLIPPQIESTARAMTSPSDWWQFWH